MTDHHTQARTSDDGGAPTVGPADDVASRGPRRTESKVAAAAFVVLITIPGVLYATGGRAPTLDNRTPTPPPELAAVADLDQEALSQLQDHLGETVPGRGLAVRADAWADLNVLRESPSPDVVLGRDGWLFLTESLVVPCEWAGQMGEVRLEMERAASLVESTGRRWVTAVAPDKSAFHSDRASGRVDLTCIDAFTDAIERDLEASPPTGYVPTWATLRSAAQSSADPLYHLQDTHWTSEGSAVFARELIEAAVPGAVASATFETVDGGERIADLTTLYGLPEATRERVVTVRRPGVETAVTGGYPGATEEDVTAGDVATFRSTGGDVLSGRTAYWHDSFGEISLPQIAPFLEEGVALRKLPLARPWVSDVLAGSDTIVYETVQRWLVPRWTEGTIVGQLAWALRAELPTAEAAPDDDGWVPVDPSTFDIVAIQQEQLPDEFQGLPLRLELRGSEVRPAPQRDREEDTPLLYDLSRLRGVTHVRLVSNEGATVTPLGLTQIDSGTGDLRR